MSRAFVKESDGDQADERLPERPQSLHTNYVTPSGLQQLLKRREVLNAQKAKLTEQEDLASKQQLKAIERDLRYYEERLRRAVPVDPGARPDDKVHFGARVEVEDEEGHKQVFVIVGEDEADAAQGKISWISPLARALLDAEVGDVVIWQRPVGDKALEVISIGKG